MATNADASRSTLWIVEAWRGMASLLVLWAHWGPPLHWPMGPMAFAFTGVDLFFVLSGFVFAPMVMAGQPPALRAYAVRRVSRIYPAYLAALALYVWLAWRAGKPLLYLPEHLLMAHMQSREMTFYYNPVFWSLPSEVAFYALAPLLAWWLGRNCQVRWGWLLLMALAARLAMIGPSDGAAQNWAYLGLHHLPGLLIEFFLGILVWQRSRQPWPTRYAWLLLLGAAVGWLALAALFKELERQAGGSYWKNGQLSLAAAACFALALWASLVLPRPGPNSWLWQLGLWGGKLSYSVYLLHIAWLTPALIWTQAWGSLTGSALALTCMGLSCWALHAIVEEPARRAGRRWAESLRLPQGQAVQKKGKIQ